MSEQILKFQSLKREFGHLAFVQGELTPRSYMFQSLKREFGHLAVEVAGQADVQEEFQSLKREFGHLAAIERSPPGLLKRRFNPSSGNSAI